ncbi:MAG: L-seryl-tRNA(Sec) selenium transferase [Gemmatimonadota bacterium]|nr:L-seryl-tRNA(Sec) selenium transferase [Gemmatimonadota bacterium]
MSDARRRLPAVHALVAEAEAAGLGDGAPRTALVESARDLLVAARAAGGTPPASGWLAALAERLASRERPSLARVLNASGVVLHTNLGRAPLAEAARRAVADALGYSTLEYDRSAGSRGSRQSHVHDLLARCTGAADALVVNNAASAVLLALTALAAGGETIVSRGELVEIGGAFRIPDILEKSGSVLVEVGTTNRTRLSDYVLALGARTRCVLKVHRSNFAVSGFVEETGVDALVEAMGGRGIPVVHDVGSGLLLDLGPWGLSGEPLVRDSAATGALTVFSADKLLGGPQAGIVVGPQALVARLAADPLARAVRPDKITLAALEATLRLYRDPATAVQAIPVLHMLTTDAATLKRRARRLARRIPGATTTPGVSAVGGGAFPDAELATTLVAVPVPSPDTTLAALRQGEPPVIARAGADAVLLDVRTLADAELREVADAVARARAPKKGTEP